MSATLENSPASTTPVAEASPTSPAGLPPARASSRRLLALSAPLLVVNASNLVMQFSDSWMVAQVGPEAVAAVLPAGLLYWVLVSFGSGMLSAVSTFVSQSLGKHEAAACGHYWFQGVCFAVLYGLLALGAIAAAPAIFGALGHEPKVMAYEITYFQWSLPGAGLQLLVFACTFFLMGVQRSAALMVASVLSVAANIFFNWVFIFGNLGAPRLEVAGAALGTVLATLLQATILFGWVLHRRQAEPFGTRRWRISLPDMGKMVRIGLPAGLHNCFDLLTWGVAMMWLVGLFGTAHLTATNIALRWTHLAFMPPFALGISLMVLVGEAIGAKDLKLANQWVRLAAFWIVGYMTACGVLYFFAREPLMLFFADSFAEPMRSEVVAIGLGVMLCAAAFQFFDGMHLVYIHALRGAGDNLWSTTYMSICAIAFMVVLGLYLAWLVPSLQSVGPWLATTFYVIFLGLGLFLRWQTGAWKKIDIFR